MKELFIDYRHENNKYVFNMTGMIFINNDYQVVDKYDHYIIILDLD